MKKIISIIISSAVAFIAIPAKAVCPVCTIAVGAGVGFSRWLGIDDRISGIWVGALIVSLIIWTIDYLNRKKIKFLGRKPLVVAGWYLLTLYPLYLGGIMGHPFNEFCGIDKLLFGAILGTLSFIAGVMIHNYLKKKNGDKSYFPFQKVAVPVSALILASLIMYLIIIIYKC